MQLPCNYDKLTPASRRKVREEYIKRQKGLCFWCKKPLDGNPPEHITNRPLNLKLFPQGFLRHPIHLQHDHSTGMTEGAVHAYCNGVMWQYHGR